MTKHLKDWYDNTLGHCVLNAESEHLSQALTSIFGFYLLQLGLPQQTAWLEQSPIRHRFCLHTGHESLGDIQGDFVTLPFQNDSIDAVVLPHILEFHPHPQIILAEAARVLLPEGALLILGFNPWSSFGIKKLLSRSPDLPWQGKFISLYRLSNWLLDLNLEITVTEKFYTQFPINHTAYLDRFAFLEHWIARFFPSYGSVYLVVAKKKVACITPIGLKQKRHQLLLRPNLAEPTTRNHHRL